MFPTVLRAAAEPTRALRQPERRQMEKSDSNTGVKQPKPIPLENLSFTRSSAASASSALLWPSALCWMFCRRNLRAVPIAIYKF